MTYFSFSEFVRFSSQFFLGVVWRRRPFSESERRQNAFKISRISPRLHPVPGSQIPAASGMGVLKCIKIYHNTPFSNKKNKSCFLGRGPAWREYPLLTPPTRLLPQLQILPTPLETPVDFATPLVCHRADWFDSEVGGSHDGLDDVDAAVEALGQVDEPGHGARVLGRR